MRRCVFDFFLQALLVQHSFKTLIKETLVGSTLKVFNAYDSIHNPLVSHYEMRINLASL